jgi:uncharacterized membrane-anchored protein
MATPLLLLQALLAILSIGSLVCFILVLIKMFQQGQTGLGITCIVLAFCAGIGTLIAFIYGWVKAREWDLQKVMMVWSGLVAANILLSIIFLVMGGMAAVNQPPPNVHF